MVGILVFEKYDPLCFPEPVNCDDKCTIYITSSEFLWDFGLQGLGHLILPSHPSKPCASPLPQPCLSWQNCVLEV